MNGNEVVAILGQHIRFQEMDSDGLNMPAFCPFHKGGMERSPSLYVYVGPSSGKKKPGTAFCHTCDRGWSFTGLLKALGVSPQAIPHYQEILEEEKETAKTEEARGVSFDFKVLPEQVLGVFGFVPKQLVRDGFEPTLLRAHEIGFDRRRKRIIFPIRNHLGELVGLSGRTVRDEIPRYKIYKKELWEVLPGYDFQKGQVLWGMDKIYPEYMQGAVDKPIIICEGFKACLWVQQAGFTESVALLGSYLTKQQRFLLERTATEVILFLDNDDAGVRGTARIASMSPNFQVKVAKYPTTEPISPDDLSVKQVQDAIEGAVPAVLWRVKHDRKDRL